ncbi:MAG: hypothetical protein ACHQQQ_14480 [Bacteroidota bacterium]
METQKYWQVIQEKVCQRCIDGDGKGNCRIDPSHVCELKAYFPLILEVVNSVSSEYIQDYVIRLRSVVCSECSHQSEDGQCRFRDKVDCALDRYYPLVVEAIEEVKKQEKASRKAV